MDATMTERQRVLAILKGEQPDQVPWFADLDYWATAQIRRGERPKDFKQSDAYLAWRADLGAGFYMQGYYPFRETADGCRVETWRDGAKRYRSIETPKETLRDCFIEAMTPAPVGDLPVEEWAGYLAGSKTLAWGGIPAMTHAIAEEAVHIAE